MPEQNDKHIADNTFNAFSEKSTFILILAFQ